ncbi:hypothetical protein LCGC14_0664030 [marine sediment metagenome]|uniref:Bacteriophage head to tail connecting protein n=1 Tax=marine sediment metagenome TaxID=412755 RepID=A0A0F9U0Z9_9ZZZZ
MNEISLRMKQLEEVKEDYLGLWEYIGRYVNSRRELIRDSQKWDKKGQYRGKRSYSGVANAALNIWVDGMQGFMVAKNLTWFVSVMDDWRLNEIDEVRVFLQEYDKAMYAAFKRSNFYSILSEWFRDAGSIGTAALYTEEDIANGTEVHIPIHPREIFISENKYGEVDTLFRKFQLTARQAVQKFEEGKLSQAIIDNSKQHPEKNHEFVHAVFPNDEPMFGKLDSTNKKFKSVYMETSKESNSDGSEKTAREGGFDIFPYAVWRYRKNSDEIYGYSPAAEAMAEILSLNQIGKSLLRAAQMSVASPLNVPEHMRGNVQMQPDGYNYFDNPKDIITPINTGITFPIGVDREEKIERLIEDKWRVEFFLVYARAEREMTATEVMERQSEKAVLMGPQVDRLISEGLSKVFDIVSDIEDRAGRLPSPPPVLLESSSNIEIQFTGPLAQAQKRMFALQPIRVGLNEISQASVLFPNITDRINEKKLSETILDSTDFPQVLMNSDEEVDAIREARAQAEAQRLAMETAGQMADAYPKIKDAPEEGSPAEAIAEAIGV